MIDENYHKRAPSCGNMTKEENCYCRGCYHVACRLRLAFSSSSHQYMQNRARRILPSNLIVDKPSSKGQTMLKLENSKKQSDHDQGRILGARLS